MLNVDFFAFFTNFDDLAWLAAGRDSASQLIDWVLRKYAAAPALVLGVGVALALPAIATVGAILRLFPGGQPKRAREPRTQRTLPPSAWRQRAWLEQADSTSASYKISTNMVRIGRETDNDLCLSDPSVHRYHAVLEHTSEAEYIISYVGDPDTSGLLIDGRPILRQRLRGGEVLEFGAIKLRFALSPG